MSDVNTWYVHRINTHWYRIYCPDLVSGWGWPWQGVWKAANSKTHWSAIWKCCSFNFGTFFHAGLSAKASVASHGSCVPATLESEAWHCAKTSRLQAPMCGPLWVTETWWIPRGFTSRMASRSSPQVANVLKIPDRSPKQNLAWTFSTFSASERASRETVASAVACMKAFIDLRNSSLVPGLKAKSPPPDVPKVISQLAKSDIFTSGFKPDTSNASLLSCVFAPGDGNDKMPRGFFKYLLPIQPELNCEACESWSSTLVLSVFKTGNFNSSQRLCAVFLGRNASICTKPSCCNRSNMVFSNRSRAQCTAVFGAPFRSASKNRLISNHILALGREVFIAWTGSEKCSTPLNFASWKQCCTPCSAASSKSKSKLMMRCVLELASNHWQRARHTQGMSCTKNARQTALPELMLKFHWNQNERTCNKIGPSWAKPKL